MANAEKPSNVAPEGADEQIVAKGVSFQVPPHGNWKLRRNRGGFGDDVQLSTQSSATHSHVVLQSYGRIKEEYESAEQLRQFIEHDWNLDMESPRYEVDFSNVSVDQRFGDLSIHVHRRYRDKGAVNRGEQRFLIVEEYGYFFVHPDYPDGIVISLYSERFMAGEQTYVGIENRKAFFENYKITRKE